MNKIHINASSDQLEYLIGLVSMDIGLALQLCEKLASPKLREGVEIRINSKQLLRTYLISLRINNDQNSKAISTHSY